MTDIYVAPEVQHVLDLHPYLADAAFRASPFRAQIAAQSETLHKAFQAGDPRVAMQVMSWWPHARGRALADVMRLTFSPQDAERTICREYGFETCEDARDLGDLSPEPVFEQALDVMLEGDGDGLKDLLGARPVLAKLTSKFGHGATLLHYLGANGVETHRQVVPRNAADLAGLLISRGADRTATARMYGGGTTPLMLAQTSAHPERAGIAQDLVRALAN